MNENDKKWMECAYELAEEQLEKGGRFYDFINCKKKLKKIKV